MEFSVEGIEELVRVLYDQISHQGRPVHNKLQTQVAYLAQVFDLVAEKEYPIFAYWQSKNGFIDVVWLNGDELVAAFEIDAHFRQKSIRKLLAVNTKYRFWFYFGQDKIDSAVRYIDTEDKIRFVNLRRNINDKPQPHIDQHLQSQIQSSIQTEMKKGTYSVAKIRERYPRAYSSWTEEDKLLLKESFNKGLQVIELAKLLKRKPGAIRSRLRKLGLW